MTDHLHVIDVRCDLIFGSADNNMLSTAIKCDSMPAYATYLTPVRPGTLFFNDRLSGRKIPRAGFDIVFRDLCSGYELRFRPSDEPGAE